MTLLLRRALLSLAAMLAVLTAASVLAVPAEAATFTTRCVVAREMRIYHTSTSANPGRTKLYFGRTIYTDMRRNNRYRAYWYTLTEGWHRGWISANSQYVRLGACGTIT